MLEETHFHPVFNPKQSLSIHSILMSPVSQTEKLSALLSLKASGKLETTLELVDAIYALSMSSDIGEKEKANGTLEALKFYTDFAVAHQSCVHKLQIKSLMGQMDKGVDLESIKASLDFLLSEGL